MSDLHPIDKPNGGYTKKELDEFMVFCILDTAVPYEMVCKSFNYLRKNKMTTRKNLKIKSPELIELVLRDSGYRFPKQHAKRIATFGNNPIDLSKATRDEIVEKVKGVHYKLASMFLRNTRGLDYAVLDVHTRRWLRKELLENSMLKEHEIKRLSYAEEEDYFKSIAKIYGKSTKDLDLEIWQKMRVGNK